MGIIGENAVSIFPNIKRVAPIEKISAFSPLYYG
jgi:hypothetical protein